LPPRHGVPLPFGNHRAETIPSALDPFSFTHFPLAIPDSATFPFHSASPTRQIDSGSGFVAARRRMQETAEIGGDRTRKLTAGRLPSTNGDRENFEPEATQKLEVSSQACLTPSLPSTVCDRTLAPCTGSAANSTKTRRKSLSRRLVESVGQQEVRQHGYVYQKNRRQSDK